MTDQKIRPCPFCGSDTGEVRVSYHIDGYAYCLQAKWVCINSCLATGPEVTQYYSTLPLGEAAKVKRDEKIKSKALEAYNKRFIDSELEGADIMTINDGERILIEKTLSAVDHNRKMAANLLGISESTIYRKIRLYGLAIDTAERKEAENVSGA